MDIKLEKSQTGIASEFYVAGELCRRGYNVTLTFGNTKAIDLLVQKKNKVLAIQVKGIQANKSICWDLDKTKISDTPDLFLVLVNLHVDTPNIKPDFFILTASEASNLFTDSIKDKETHSSLAYNEIKKLSIYEDRWDIFGDSEIISEEELWRSHASEKFLSGYGEFEPQYTSGDIKEPNPEYKVWKEK